jgi:hypothetical protein
LFAFLQRNQMTHHMKQFFAGITLVVFITGCQTQASNTSKEEKANPAVAEKATGDNVITFKINGQQVNTTGWTITRFAWSSDAAHEWLNITSNMRQEKRTININLNGATPGTYTLNESGAAMQESHGSFFPDYMEDMTNSFSFSEGVFNITEVDTVRHRVNATFSGVVKNLKGESLKVTEGQVINGLLNINVIRY